MRLVVMRLGGVRRALLLASSGRYLVLAINLAATAVTARLLTPEQYGISALGMAVFAIPEALRELGSVAYLVQQTDLTLDKIRSMFTVSLIVTAVMSVALALVSDPVAALYGLPGLGTFLHIAAIGYAMGPFTHPIYALMSRELAFGRLAVIDVATTVVNAISSIVLVALGFGFLALAWASVLAAGCAMLLGFYFKRDFAIFRPALREWRGVLRFGVYGSATALLYRTSESLFYMVFGKLLSPRDVGVFLRAVTLATFPERVILAGIGAVALPAFSDHARRGEDMKAAYLRGLSLISAVQWPALLLLMILADPIVRVILGPQWNASVPLVRILAAAFLMNFPTSLNYPIQVAVGAIRATVGLAFLQVALSLTTLIVAAEQGGALAVALAVVFTTPFNVVLSVWVVRRYVPFRTMEFAAALWRSAVAAAFSAAGPLAILLIWGPAMPLALVAPAVALSGGLWLAGLALTRHALLGEILNLVGWAR
jgi:O-antigen/teichoic acid export membrane protein